MEVIPQVIHPGDTIASIIDSKKGDLFLFDVGFGEIGDDAYPIFIIGHQWPSVWVGRVRLHDPVAFGGNLGLVDDYLAEGRCLFFLLDVFEGEFKLARILHFELCFGEHFGVRGQLLGFADVEAWLRAHVLSFLLYFFGGGSWSDGLVSVDVAAIDVYFGEGDDGFADEGGALQAGQIFILVSAMRDGFSFIAALHYYKSNEIVTSD
jgi:hypothetical protein